LYGTVRAFSEKYETDTHDDFKPKYKGEPVSVDELIKKDIAAHRVFVYMKGNPAGPMCGFSNQACRILDAYGVDYGSRDVLVDPALREGVKRFSQWPTIPQVFVDGEFVGGSDILMNMHQSGELTTLLHSGDKS
jgi:monothiol glutaredoxin